MSNSEQATPTTGPNPPRLMEQVHAACRRRHLSVRTEEAYRA